MNTAAESSNSASTMAAWPPSLSFRLTSATLYDPATQPSTEAAVTSFLRAFPASPIPWPEKEPEPPTTVTSGLRQLPLFESSSPVGSSSKTYPVLSLTATSSKSSTTFVKPIIRRYPRFGCQLVTWGPIIKGRAIGLLPTPTDPSRGGGSSRSGKRQNETPTLVGMARKGMLSKDGLGGPLNPALTEWLMAWPISWTAIAPLPMARWFQWLSLLGDF